MCWNTLFLTMKSIAPAACEKGRTHEGRTEGESVVWYESMYAGRDK
jgi:hypothetical protein